MIKKIKLGLMAVMLMTFSANAQELPQPSPYADVLQTIGLTEVKVEYSRPGVKDREIFGGLLDYGKVWRTGANAATTIMLSTDAIVGGNEVEAGTYSVFSIPGEDKWQVMLNSDVNASEGSYDPENNVAVLNVEPMSSDMTETMTFTFANVKENSADWTFQWEKAKWMIPITTAVEEQALENIENKIKEIEGAYGVYNTSARYYLEHDKDLEQALKWSKKSVEISPKFWNVHTLSKIHYAMGNKKEAIAAAELSLKLSEEAEYMPYIKMNKKNLEEWGKK